MKFIIIILSIFSISYASAYCSFSDLEAVEFNDNFYSQKEGHVGFSRDQEYMASGLSTDDRFILVHDDNQRSRIIKTKYLTTTSLILVKWLYQTDCMKVHIF